MKSVSAAGELLAAPAIMLAEVAGALARRTGDRQLGYQIVQQISRLPTLQIVAVDESLARYAARLASDLQLRGADALYVATASRLRLPLLTWNQEQLLRASAVITARTLEQIS